MIRAGAVVRTTVLDERCEVAAPRRGSAPSRRAGWRTTTTSCWSVATRGSAATWPPARGSSRGPRLARGTCCAGCTAPGGLRCRRGEVAARVDLQPRRRRDVERPLVGRGDVRDLDRRVRVGRRPAPPTAAPAPCAGCRRRGTARRPSARRRRTPAGRVVDDDQAELPASSSVVGAVRGAARPPVEASRRGRGRRPCPRARAARPAARSRSTVPHEHHLRVQVEAGQAVAVQRARVGARDEHAAQAAAP